MKDGRSMLRFFLDHHIQKETAAALINAAVPNKPYGFCGRYAPCLLTLPLRAPGGFILARKKNNSSVCIWNIRRRKNSACFISFVLWDYLLIRGRPVTVALILAADLSVQKALFLCPPAVIVQISLRVDMWTGPWYIDCGECRWLAISTMRSTAQEPPLPCTQHCQTVVNACLPASLWTQSHKVRCRCPTDRTVLSFNYRRDVIKPFTNKSTPRWRSPALLRWSSFIALQVGGLKAPCDIRFSAGTLLSRTLTTTLIKI